MAVIRRVDLKGGIVIEGAYMNVSSVQIDRLSGVIIYTVAAFTGREARDKAYATRERLRRAARVYTAAADVHTEVSRPKPQDGERPPMRDMLAGGAEGWGHRGPERMEEIRASHEALTLARDELQKANAAIADPAAAPFFMSPAAQLDPVVADRLIGENAPLDAIYAAIYDHCKAKGGVFEGGSDHLEPPAKKKKTA